MSLLKKLFFLFNLGCILALLLSYVSPHYSVSDIWPISSLGLIYPYLLLLNLACICIWILVDFRQIWLSLLAILIGWSSLTSFFTIRTQVSENTDINILSYNISNGSYYNTDNKLINIEIESIAHFLDKEKELDILCIQEGSKRVYDIFRQMLPRYQGVYLNDKRAMIFSKLPILKKGSIDFGTKINSAVWADVKKGDNIIRVYSVHLASNALTRTANAVIKDSDLQEKKTWGSIMNMLERYRLGALKREAQAHKLTKHIDACSYPVILCGDFNDTPQSHTYRLLTHNMQDAFRHSGLGLGSTFRGSIPFLRIDFILTSKDIKPLSFDVLNKRFSDHYPIHARLQFLSTTQN